jgi:hypothetical protein
MKQLAISVSEFPPRSLFPTRQVCFQRRSPNYETKKRLVVIPLSFLRRLDSLKYTSVVALVSIGYLVVLVVAHFVKGDTIADRGDIRVVRWGGAIPALSSFPVVVFAYTCHQNVSISP